MVATASTDFTVLVVMMAVFIVIVAIAGMK